MWVGGGGDCSSSSGTAAVTAAAPVREGPIRPQILNKKGFDQRPQESRDMPGGVRATSAPFCRNE